MIDQLAITGLVILVATLSTINLAFSLRHYRRTRRDRRAGARAAAFRGTLKSVIIWSTCASFLVSRIVFYVVPDNVDARRYVNGISISLFSGVLIVGLLWLVVGWIADHGGDEAGDA